jgi:TetR/AcrR family transcriptional repressor of mexJK operon
VIEAATRVFLRAGFTDASVDVIAAEAGVSKQTIYNHFGDKRKLFAAVIEATQRQGAQAGETRFATEQMRNPDLAQQWALPRPALEAAIAEAIQAQVLEGVLDVPDTALAAHQLVLLTAQEAVHQSQYGMRELSPAQVEKIVDDGVEMWLRCYRTRQ